MSGVISSSVCAGGRGWWERTCPAPRLSVDWTVFAQSPAFYKRVHSASPPLFWLSLLSLFLYISLSLLASYKLCTPFGWPVSLSLSPLSLILLSSCMCVCVYSCIAAYTFRNSRKVRDNNTSATRLLRLYYLWYVFPLSLSLLLGLLLFNLYFVQFLNIQNILLVIIRNVIYNASAMFLFCSPASPDVYFYYESYYISHNFPKKIHSLHLLINSSSAVYIYCTYIGYNSIGEIHYKAVWPGRSRLQVDEA